MSENAKRSPFEEILQRIVNESYKGVAKRLFIPLEFEINDRVFSQIKEGVAPVDFRMIGASGHVELLDEKGVISGMISLDLVKLISVLDTATMSVFSVGETDEEGLITDLFIDGDKLIVGVDCGCEEEEGLKRLTKAVVESPMNTIILSNGKEFTWNIWNEDLRPILLGWIDSNSPKAPEPKQEELPMFRSADGVAIFEGDTWHTVFLKDGIDHENEVVTKRGHIVSTNNVDRLVFNDNSEEFMLRFSTLELAQRQAIALWFADNGVDVTNGSDEMYNIMISNGGFQIHSDFSNEIAEMNDKA